jgi:hypothetical protein
MCTSKPKPPPAPVIPQQYSPELIDQAALDRKAQDRRVEVNRFGRNSTILAGKAPGGAPPPTGGGKTALGR